MYDVPAHKNSEMKDKQANRKQIDLSDTKTADSLVTDNKSAPRYNLNNSILNVTSPIGTATSFKSQNSQ